MFKKILCFCLLFSIPSMAFGSPFIKKKCNMGWEHVVHKHNEASYQHAWCSMYNGIEEYENSDKTRVDCLTKKHAVEFDFADKYYESIGQALHYGIMTGKKPKVVLILENPELEMRYFERVKKIAKKYHFDAEYITNDILNLDENGKCFNSECKCHKSNNRKNIHHNTIQQNIYFGEKDSKSSINN